jgi:hypothetical protein
MPSGSNVTEIAEAIRLAVAPAFLLTGIGAVLSVLTTRLNRIVDRERRLEDYLEGLDKQHHRPIHEALRILSRRARLTSWSITLCTSCALMICTVVALLFVGAVMDLDASTAIALLFIIAMAVLILGLLIFLREIFLGTASLVIRPKDPEF